MIWFIPPQDPNMRRWFDRFAWRLMENSPSVTALLAHNPFAASPPRYMRILVHRYHFTDRATREATGQIWKADYLGEFPDVRPRIP
jgi:hypothetical protein